MNRFLKLASIILIGHALTGCSPTGDESAKSISVDSSNINGEAPVKYEGNNPTDTMLGLSPADDTGKRANTKAESEKH